METDKTDELCLTDEPKIVHWPAMHYVFVEKTGPFQENAPKAWQELHQVLPEISKTNKITGFTSLYKLGPSIYRAGVSVAEKPQKLPLKISYEIFRGGKYSCFVLTGPYENLPKACGRVFQIVAETKLPLRDDYFLENYVNDPRTTPEEELITEILVPTV